MIAHIRRGVLAAVAGLLVLLAGFGVMGGLANAAVEAKLGQYIGTVKPGDLVAGADRFGAIQANAPLVPVYKGDALVGHAYLTSDFVNTTGYSGRPIHVLVGLA